MPLLVGLDGVNKMSKSLGNAIGITDAPDDMFGKLMSISDDLMWAYFDLLSFESTATIKGWQQEVAAGLNPRDVKYRLAHEITARFHGAPAAGRAQAAFIARFQKGALPEDLPEVRLDAISGMAIANLLKEAGLVTSTSEALRLLGQGAVRIDGERVEDRALLIQPGTSQVIQVGKRRAARVTVA